MKATQLLHNLGQSLWLDNITRDLINSGTLKRYRDELSVTGLTSNPTIFDHAIKNSSDYDAAIRKKLNEDKSEEELFFELALEDLTLAADLFRPIFDRTNGVDGWVSLEDLSEIMSAGGGDCEAVLEQFAAAGIDINDLATKLQDDGAKSFVSSWNELMGVIASKSATLAKTG